MCEIQNRKSAFHKALPATNHCQNWGKFIWLSQLDPLFTGHGTKALDPSTEFSRIFIWEETFCLVLFLKKSNYKFWKKVWFLWQERDLCTEMRASWLSTETCKNPIQVKEERRERRIGKRQKRKRESKNWGWGGTSIWRERTLASSRERKGKRNKGRQGTRQRNGGKIEKVQRAESKKWRT